jgi:hypothetical protein
VKLKPLITSLVAAAGLSLGASASAVVVGGIDFGALGELSHLETTTLAETLVNAPGQTLLGYGQVNTINGLDQGDYCAIDADCRLFFAFSYNTTAFNGLAASFDQGSVIVYYDPNGANRNLLDFSSAANLAYIQGLTAWVELDGHASVSPLCTALLGVPTPEICATSPGGNVNVSFTGSGLLDVVLGGLGLADVQAYLDANQEVDGLGGFADITFTTSGSNSVINVNDVCTGQPGQWCLAGSADLRGKTVLQVPEPGSLALFGLALAGLGMTRRKS